MKLCPSTGCVILNVLLYNHGFPLYNFQQDLVIIMSDAPKSWTNIHCNNIRSFYETVNFKMGTECWKKSKSVRFLNNLSSRSIISNLIKITEN